MAHHLLATEHDLATKLREPTNHSELELGSRNNT
jgi:hypothetical protein